MNLPSRTVLAVLLVLLLGVSLGGCSNSSSPRSVVHVVAVNQNQPLMSDIVKVDSQGNATVYEDAVEVEVRCDPADSVLTIRPNGPYGFVVLDRYEINFESPEQIPAVSGSLGWTVHTGEAITGTLVVVPADHKTELPLFGLIDHGEIEATARITFYGYEATSNYKFTVSASLPVEFANWKDQ